LDLSPELRALLPTADDVAFYQEHGWWMAPKVIPDEVIDEAARGAERHFAGERDRTLPVTEGFGDWKPGDPDAIRNSEYVTLQNSQIRALSLQPIIGAIASRLTGKPVIRLWDDQLVSKAPARDDAAPVVGWHTDAAYWLTCTSRDMLTAWVPLHDCPEEMGPVTYIDGSHRWPDTETMRTFNEQDLAKTESRFFGAEGRSQQQVMALRKGQMSFHHARLIHGSGPNRGTDRRLSLALHMQDGDNRWREYRNEQGELWEITNDRLARKLPDGTPDYADPDIFPVMWSSETA
jgi:ectoine hydroxylase-related dioxygenase (phytanoyl-CoA dioxygenase family)